MNKSWVPRILPFATYMVFILIKEIMEAVIPHEISTSNLTPFIYIIQIVSVTILLAIFWKSYDELHEFKFILKSIMFAIIGGLLVFVLWINMDWKITSISEPDQYNPQVLSQQNLYYTYLAIRIAGSSLIVPIFEELFWRSFILRYIIRPEYYQVKLGTFTWPSFLISSLLFGLEHHFILAGIMAGLFYNIILYKTKNLYYCIIAHAITNFTLCIYVISTGSWHFW